MFFGHIVIGNGHLVMGNRQLVIVKWKKIIENK